MIWLLLALAAAGSESLRDLFIKKSTRRLDPRVVAWAWRFLATIFLLPLLLVLPLSSVQQAFWPAIAASLALNMIATLLMASALKHSDLSLISPLATFTAVFALAFSPFVIGELPSLMGLVGVLLIVAGSYVLNLRAGSGLLAPLISLSKDKGARMMMGAALAWGLVAPIDKIAVTASSPVFYSIAINALLAIALAPLLARKLRGRINRSSLNNLVPLGLFSALMLIAEMVAITMTLVPFVAALKKLSALFGVMLGKVALHEKEAKERLPAAAIMVVGAALIALSFGGV
ncbi:EamA family transporter [Candidatus Micrarchaeota archaeon]|nr:EamA family transporter [Candidatus Micrarchaeota archaeon]